MQPKPSGESLSSRILLTILILGFFIGCAIVPPVPVELTKFADSASHKNLTYDSSGNQPFDLNISKYTMVGNNSEPPDGGVITGFTFMACPHEHLGSNVSNLTMHWPTGGSTEFHSGYLTSCQMVSVDPTEFNYYLSAKSAYSFMGMLNSMTGGGGLPTSEETSFLMLKNPRMHDYREPPDFQFAVPYAPISVFAELLNSSLGETLPEEYLIYDNTKIHGMKYLCHERDQIRVMYGPTRSWDISMYIPSMNISIPSVFNFSENVSASATLNLYDLPCPAYGEPGKYRAEVRSLYAEVTNYTGWIPDSVFYDDFNSSVLDPIWSIRETDG
jgi:hypothetical protein